MNIDKDCNCYNCKYRGSIPGDAHSCCNFPGLKSDLFDSIDFFEENKKIAKELKIIGNPIGIKNGWFFWPSNFDPVWLERCDGFEKK